MEERTGGLGCEGGAEAAHLGSPAMRLRSVERFLPHCSVQPSWHLGQIVVNTPITGEEEKVRRG